MRAEKAMPGLDETGRKQVQRALEDLVGQGLVDALRPKGAKTVGVRLTDAGEARVRAMYATAFGRAPTRDESADALAFVKELSAEYGKPDHVKAWTDLAHVLITTKEFVFVE